MTPILSRTSGTLPASAVAQGPQLIIHSVDKLVNTTFICTVTNAVGTGRAEQVVLVRGKRVLGAACDKWVCSPGAPPSWSRAALERLCRRPGEGFRPTSPIGEQGPVAFLPCPRWDLDWGDRAGVGRGVRR